MKIAIIGAGWSGIGCLRILKNKYQYADITVFEALDDVGGTWHPSNAYAGLALHSPCRHIEYFDYPLPAGVDPVARIGSRAVYSYLRDYCRARGLLANIRFNTTLSRLDYDSAQRKFSLQLNGAEEAGEYDYVIYTNGCSSRVMPALPGAENFTGEILHSFDLTEARMAEIVAQNKKLVVLGGSKTAGDIILNFVRAGYGNLKWVLRKNYWFVRFSEAFYERSMKQNRQNWRDKVFLLGSGLGLMLAKFNARLAFRTWVWFGVVHTYGPAHKDDTKFHLGSMDDEQMTVLRRVYAERALTGEVASMQATGITLSGGQKLDCDVLVCCTGSANKEIPLPVRRDGAPYPLNDVRTVYGRAVIPDLPGLIFTSYGGIGFGTARGLNFGEWIAKYIARDQAGRTDLAKRATRFDSPFFQNHAASSPAASGLADQSDRVETYVRQGELDRMAYLKWISAFGWGSKSIPPLEFTLQESEHA